MPVPRRLGPKSALTAKLLDELCGHLETGMPVVFACARVGIHRATYYKWLEKAADVRALQEEGHPVTAAQAKLVASADRIELARNYGGGWLYEQLLQAPANIWVKYSCALERQFHEFWSTRQGAYQVNVDKKTGAIEVKLSFDVDSDEAKHAAEQLRER